MNNDLIVQLALEIVNIRNYENLSELLGRELGSKIYTLIGEILDNE